MRTRLSKTILSAVILAAFLFAPGRLLAWEPGDQDRVGPAAPPNDVQFQTPPFGESGGVRLASAPPVVAAAPAPDVLPPGPGGPEPPPTAEYYSLDELKSEMKKLAWTKGDYTITPYGIGWANMAWETNRSVNGDYVLYVSRPRANAEEQFHVDARSTRLGFDVLGPQVTFLGGMKTGGKVEIDFQRNFDTENRAGVLLRHAYGELKNDEYRFLFGQTWDVISPLNPGVLFYSVGWDGGNIGYRRAQARAERYYAVSDELLLTAQGSLNVQLVTDVSTATPVAYSGDQSGWPIIEGRIATTIGPRGPGCLPIEIGVSGHIGETIYDFRSPPFVVTANGVPERTWSLNADIKVPISSRFGVQGEMWMGQNLGPFLGCIGQSVDVVGTANTPATGLPIYSRGGWFDVWYDWTPRLHSHAGYSIDDPIDADVTSGRIYNAFIFSNISFDVTPKFLVGFEYTSWRTLWKGPYADAPDQNFNFVAKYGF